jgi:hypothetical protein
MYGIWNSHSCACGKVESYEIHLYLVRGQPDVSEGFIASTFSIHSEDGSDIFLQNIRLSPPEIHDVTSRKTWLFRMIYIFGNNKAKLL